MRRFCDYHYYANFAYYCCQHENIVHILHDNWLGMCAKFAHVAFISVLHLRFDIVYAANKRKPVPDWSTDLIDQHSFTKKSTMVSVRFAIFGLSHFRSFSVNVTISRCW